MDLRNIGPLINIGIGFNEYFIGKRKFGITKSYLQVTLKGIIYLRTIEPEELWAVPGDRGEPLKVSNRSRVVL
jgi:hypothetical protein